MSRKVCVFTGTRAEYGLLMWLMQGLQKDPETELQLLVTGMHLCPEFGMTVNAIEADGFTVDARVDMVLAGDSPAAIAKAMALGTMGFADALDRLRPDVLVALGDRYETLAVAQAALALGIPIAHVHGGEATEGLIDEAIRHSVTKMSALHFTAAEPYRRRVIQMGEDPATVFNVGAPGIDNLAHLPLLDRAGLEATLDGFKLGEMNFLVTYHPVTLSHTSPELPMRALLDAIDQYPQARIIITKANSDTEGRVINRMIDQWAAANPGRVHAVASLGQIRYLSAMKLVDAVLGNSSSGIIEVPAAGKPTVNQGDRQLGRLRAASVIDCDETFDAIAAAIRQALSPEFRALAASGETPYGRGGASDRMRQLLKTMPLRPKGGAG